jgi:hypothetical protein
MGISFFEGHMENYPLTTIPEHGIVNIYPVKAKNGDSEF